MKTKQAFVTLVSALGLSISASSIADNSKFVAADNTVETAACIAAAENNVKKYRQLVESFRSSGIIKINDHRLFANKLNCNDVSVFKFARQYGAETTARYISRYLRRSVVISEDVAQVAQIDRSFPIVVSSKIIN